MKPLITALFLLSFVVSFAQKPKTKTSAQEVYFPGKDADWKKKTPEQAGMNSQKLKGAIEFSILSESKNPRNLEESHYRTTGREPYGYAVGPFKDRGDVSGVILKGGYIIAEWGDPFRVDLTYSVTKSFVSTTIGLAFDKGLITSVTDTVWKYVPPILAYNATVAPDKATTTASSQWLTPFETPHNRKITWDHLLRQVSDWEGTLWGKPEWADRPGPKPEDWVTRQRNEPGKVYEYNDVRVNALALAGLCVWRKPLPLVLKEYIMDPIGASTTWQWYGYENSYVVMDGQIMQSVSGGGHWGGGMVISARDMARFGYLTLRRGKWKDKQLLSENWVKMALTPTLAEPTYGFMNWFLNTEKKLIPAAPATAFMHLGNGTNIVYVDPENDLVVVTRWIERNAVSELIEKVLAAKQ